LCYITSAGLHHRDEPINQDYNDMEIDTFGVRGTCDIDSYNCTLSGNVYSKVY